MVKSSWIVCVCVAAAWENPSHGENLTFFTIPSSENCSLSRTEMQPKKVSHISRMFILSSVHCVNGLLGFDALASFRHHRKYFDSRNLTPH